MNYLKPNWRDMSQWLVHFTDGKGLELANDKMMGILSSGRILAQTRHGIAKNDERCTPTACLSEIPLDQIGRLASTRKSPYGIVFTKEFIQSKGGGPILYAYKDSPIYVAVQELLKIAQMDDSNPFWQLAPFIDAPGDYGSKKYYFDWEREWRVADQIDFEVEDVDFLIIPERFHESARMFFEDAKTECVGPSYQCPYIDSQWSWERLKSEFPDKFK